MTTPTNTNTTPAADLETLERQLREAKAAAMAKGHETLRQIGGRCPKGTKLVELGSAAAALEALGFSCSVTSVDELYATLETARNMASAPLVHGKNVPISWLKTETGLPLGTNGLSAIAQAIETAEQLDVDWRTWLTESTASQVVLNVLPDMQTQLEAKKAEANKPEHVKAFEAAAAELERMRATFAGMPNKRTNDGDKLRKQIVALASKVARSADAFKVDVRPKTEEVKPATPQRGDIVRKTGDETLYVIGRSGELIELMTARVAKNLGAIRAEIAKRTDSKPYINEITLEMLAQICLSAEMATKFIQGDTCSVAEAVELIRKAVEEYRASKDAEPKPGDLYKNDAGVEIHVCNGKYGRCAKHYPSREMRLPVSLGFIAEQADCNKDELTREMAIKACGRCPECGDKQYSRGNQTVEQFEAALIKLHKELEQRRTTTTIAIGGASGNFADHDSKGTSNRLRRKAKARDKVARALAAMPGTKKTVGGKKGKGGGKKGKNQD